MSTRHLKRKDYGAVAKIIKERSPPPAQKQQEFAVARLNASSDEAAESHSRHIFSDAALLLQKILATKYARLA